MAICGCSPGLVATAAVALLLLPAQYLVPEPTAVGAPRPRPALAAAALDVSLARVPPLDLVVTLLLLALAALAYLAEFVQRKVAERRIAKLNGYLSASVERLRAWDAQQERLESTLKLVRNATAEYNLLLYLLLRRQRASAACCPADRFLDKPTDDLAFLTCSVDV